MAKTIEPIELEDFIRKILQDIESGAEIKEGKRTLKETIDFEISISETKKLEGDIKIYIAKGGGNLQKESIAKIKFSIWPEYPERDYSKMI